MEVGLKDAIGQKARARWYVCCPKNSWRIMILFSRRARPAVLSILILAVTACGGGDGGSADTGNQNGSPTGGTGNAAPTIQGQPGTSVQPSQSYTFQPSANDPNGDALTFSATNLPAWASLNTTTGRISGTPSAADIGTYGDITVTVSDGSATASLGPFSIAVTDLGSGSATLSWVPPTQNADGSALTNLAGYEIRYGQDPGALSSEISLDNPSLSVYVIENLASGTWYFAVAAVNTAGTTSDLSNVASKTIS
jgi:hypothetical protein